MTPPPSPPNPRWRNPLIVIVTAVTVFALGQRASQVRLPPQAPSRNGDASGQKAVGPNSAAKSFPISVPNSGAPSAVETPPTAAQLAGADPDRASPSLQNMIEGATLVSEAVSRPDARGRVRRARIYRTGDTSGRMPFFRVLETLAPLPNGGFRVLSRAGMTTDTLLLKVTADVTPETLRTRVARQGARVLRVSPLGNFVVVGFAGGQEPWRVDEMVERLTGEGLSQVEPNYLYFPL
jgi:hypothetical protein